MFRSLSIQWRFLLTVFLIAFIFVACDGQGSQEDTEPKIIAAAPRQMGGGEPDDPPASVLVVHNAFLDLRVYDVAAAAAQSEQIALNNGGYLVSSQAWFDGDERQNITLILAVPVGRFETVRNGIYRLGTLVSETVTDNLSGSGSGGQVPVSHITIQFRPANSQRTTTTTIAAAPHIPTPTGWNPGQTFQRAFAVSATIFQFLIDIFIWVAVVAGPFIAIGFGVRALVKRQSGNQHPLPSVQHNSDEAN